jgi:hypothetical protein
MCASVRRVAAAGYRKDKHPSRPLRADTTAERRHRTGYHAVSQRLGFRDPPPTPATQTDRQAGRGGRAERRANSALRYAHQAGAHCNHDSHSMRVRPRRSGGPACGVRRPPTRREPSQTRNAPKVTAFKRVMQFESSSNCRAANLQRRVYRICAKPVIH